MTGGPTSGPRCRGLADPGLVDAHTHPGADGRGRPLDEAVVYDADPRTDLAALDTPRAVILRARLIPRRTE